MRLGILLRKYRIIEEKTVRDLSESIGISAPTLSRVERGELMDGDTLAKILKWLMTGEKGKV